MRAYVIRPFHPRSRQDACLYLVIAMVVRGETRLKGVSACNDKVDVMTFLNQQVPQPLQQIRRGG